MEGGKCIIDFFFCVIEIGDFMGREVILRLKDSWKNEGLEIGNIRIMESNFKLYFEGWCFNICGLDNSICWLIYLSLFYFVDGNFVFVLTLLFQNDVRI